MRTVASIVLIMMLSACGLNQPGTNDSDNSSSVNANELAVVKQPAEAAVEQMKSADPHMASMEDKGDMQSTETAPDQSADTASAESGMASTPVDSEVSKDAAAAPEAEQSDVSKKSEQQSDIKG